MKKFILTFFIIILIVIINKEKDNFVSMTEAEQRNYMNSQQRERNESSRDREQFEKKLGELTNCRTNKIKGCLIKKLVNTNPEDFYNCHINQCKTILGSLSSFVKQSGYRQQRLGRILGQQVKNYFIDLYINSMEKYYCGPIIVIPTPYVAGKIPKAHYIRTLPYHRFMEDSHELSKNYSLKSLFIDDKKNLTITQFSGIFVPMGFKIGISNPNNNANGRLCSNYQVSPNGRTGNCIPANLRSFDKYLTGGKYYSFNEILSIFHASGGNTIVRRRQPDWQRNVTATLTTRGHGVRKEQSQFLNHTALDHTMKDSWLRDASSQNYAYGDSVFQQMIIIADKGFFNKFYSTRALRKEIRHEFQNGDFTRLRGYH